MKSRWISIVCLLCIALPAIASGTSEFSYAAFRAGMDSVFRYVDKQQVPTGILSDYGLHLIDPNPYNGVPSDTIQVDSEIWKILYTGLYYSKINDKAKIVDPTTLYPALDKSDGVRILLFDYNQFDEKAIEKGWVTFNDKVIRLVPGKPSPYVAKRCFAVALPKDSVAAGASIVFRKEAFITNSSATITKLEVDFHDGRGFQTAQWDTPIRPNTFTSVGGVEKDYLFRITLSDGSVLSCGNTVYIKSNRLITSIPKNPWKKEVVTFKKIAADNSQSGGTIQVMYLDAAKTGKKFIRPLVIVGDIDLSVLLGGSPMDLNSLGSVAGVKTAIEELSQLYDIIYLKYNDGLDDLLRNGELFRKAIKEINANRFAAYSDNTYVIGLGMGGVVSRIGTNKMEQADEDHRIHKLIAVNSPFRGLNIPVGVQIFIRHLHEFIHKVLAKHSLGINTSALNKAIALFDKPALQQLLIYRLNANYQYDNSRHESLVKNSLVTKAPSQCESVAIATGGDKELFTDYSQLLNFNNKDLQRVGKWPAWIKHGRMECHTWANALPYKSVKRIYDGTLNVNAKFLGLPAPNNSVKTYRALDSRSDMNPIDGSTGTYINTGIFEKLNSEYLSGIFSVGKLCLLPTHSALDISYTDSYNPYFIDRETAMDRYYMSKTNDVYSSFGNLTDFLVEELTPRIVGKTTEILGDAELFVDNMPDMPLIGYTWKFKNGNFRIVSQKAGKVVIRPLDYNKVPDQISVDISLPAALGLPTIPTLTLDLSTALIKIEGFDYVSRNKERFSLSALPSEDAKVEWSAAPKMVLENPTQKSVEAYLKEQDEANDVWIEARITVDDTDSYTIHRKLTSPPLEKATFHTIARGWSPTLRAHVYCLMVNVYPTCIYYTDLQFCWTNDVKIYKWNGEEVIDTNDKPPLEVVNPNMIQDGKAQIETDGNKFPCIGNLEFVVDSVVVWNPGNPIIGPKLTPGPPIEIDPTSILLTGKNAAKIIMPTVSSDEYAEGYVYCTVSDAFKNKVRIAYYVKSAWKKVYHSSVSPNPGNDKITIKVTPVGEAQGISTASMDSPIEITANLYSDMSLVRTVSFSSAEKSADISTCDLPSGTYYLNILEGKDIVDRQTIIIKH